MSKSNRDLNALGYKSKVPEVPDKNILEKVKNPKIWCRLQCKIYMS